MAKHSPRFLKLVEEAKRQVKELTVDQVKAKLDRGEPSLRIGEPGPVRLYA